MLGKRHEFASKILEATTRHANSKETALIPFFGFPMLPEFREIFLKKQDQKDIIIRVKLNRGITTTVDRGEQL